MAAAATEMGLLPGTRSSSTAFLAMKVAAICTCLGKPRFEQKRDMKSPVVMRSTLVSSLQDQLKTPANLLLGDPGDCADLFKRSWYTFLSAGNVETCRSDGIIGSPLQALLFIHLLEQVVCSVYDVPWQVDAVCHGADFFKGVEHGAVGAAHGPPVLVFGVTEFIKTSCTCSLADHGG